MLNHIEVMGRLTSDPEMRHTPNGVAVTTFTIACERDFKDKESGEKKVDFVNIVTFRQTAEFVERFFTRGRMAIISGRLQIRSYNDNDGNRRTIAEVVADNVYFGDSKKDSQSNAQSAGYSSQPYGEQFSELDDDGTPLPF